MVHIWILEKVISYLSRPFAIFFWCSSIISFSLWKSSSFQDGGSGTLEVDEIEMEDLGFEDFEVLGWLQIWDLETKELGGLSVEDESPLDFEAKVELEELLEADWQVLDFLVSCETSVFEFLKESRLGSVNS